LSVELDVSHFVAERQGAVIATGFEERVFEPLIGLRDTRENEHEVIEVFVGAHSSGSGGRAVVDLPADVFRMMLGYARRGPYGNLASIPAPLRATELTPSM